MARPRSSTTALRNVLEQSQRPIYVLNEKRLIIYCNEACTRWTGMAAEDLLGTRCDYHSQPVEQPNRQLAACLCPPPEVFAGKTMTTTIGISDSSGKTTQFQANCHPLGIDPLDDAGVVVIIAEPSELDPEGKAATSELKAENLHQHLALSRDKLALPFTLDRLVGEGILMRRVQDQVRLAIEQPTHVVVTGPVGSGREHVARTIHSNHTSTPGSLFPVSCPLITAESLQSTVTAFVKHCQQEGTLGSASLLLLDIDQLSPESQHELNGFFSIPDFQLLTIATSGTCLLSLAREGQFNQSLAYALSTLVINMPSLSERGFDIALLAQSVLEDFNAEGNHQLSGFSDEAIDRLLHHTWNGEINELVSIVRSSCQQAESSIIQESDLPVSIEKTIQAEARGPKSSQGIDLDTFLSSVERELIDRALVEAKGNKTRAAKLLGITRARLHRRLEQRSSEEPANLESRTDVS